MSDNYFQKFLELVRPEIDFNNNYIPTPPDYSDPINWVAKPEKDGQQFYVPDNSFDVNKSGNTVDVFYIHPTGFYEKSWNSDMSKERSAYERTEIMLGNQASVFNESCNIFAPEYRQATYFSFFDKKDNGQKALDLAYIDIENAFNYFIEKYNKGNPFIIAGHSQGALHANRLINRRIDNREIQKRFICCYSIGYVIPENYFNELFPNINRASSYNDTNSIISWCSVVEGFKRNREKTPFWKPSGWSAEVMNQKLVSTNPFSWTNDSNWYRDDKNKSIINKSNNYDFADTLSLHYNGAEKSIGLTRLQEFSTSINKTSGLLEARGPLIKSFEKMKYFNGDLHSFDVMLFWGSMRQNIKDRINAFL